MRHIIFILCFIPGYLFGQAIVKGSGVVYTNGTPTHSVNLNTDAELAIDTTSGYWYERSRDGLGWLAAGFRVQKLAGSSPPSGAPADKESEVQLNDVDSLYRWRAGAWQHINKVLVYTAGTGISVTGTVIANTGDLLTTNEGSLTVGAGSGTTSLIQSNTSGSTAVTLQASGIIALSESGNTITIAATEIDGSTSNELQTYSHSGTTSYTNTLSNGGGSFTLQAGGIVGISNSSGTVTISATEVDGSITNELQTIANTSDATSHTVTLSNSGGSIQLVEGSNITLTTTGTSGAGIVTIAATGGSGSTDLTFSGSSSPVTLNSSSGTDVTFTAGGINAFSATSGNITITATEVDGSISNEGSLSVSAGGSNDSQIASNTSGSTNVTISGGSGIQVTESGSTITIAATASGSNYQVWRDDGTPATAQPNANFVSNTDIAFTLTNDGANTETEVTADIPTNAVDYAEIQQVAANRLLGNSTGSTANVAEITLASGLSFSGGALTPADASATNEVLTISDGTNSEAMGGQTLTVAGAGINVTVYNPATNTLTITGTEVDGSVTNELQTFGHSGTTSYTNTLSNGGGSFTLQSSGIVTISNSSGTVTIGATEVDGSVTNELQTIANTSDATSHTVTLSNSGGSIQMVEGSGITLTTTGTSGAGVLTIAATASGTDLTYSGASSPVTLNSSSGTDVTITAGGIVSLSATSGNITISATEVDGSVTNEAWTIDGDDADTEVISNQTVKLQGAGITTTDYNPATDVLLITSTEVDGSITNELQTIANTSDATSHTVTLSNSGGSVQLVEGSGITLTTTGTSGAGIVTIASTATGNTDLSYTGTSSPVTLNSSTGTDVTITAGGIVSFSASSGNITISATEVDGSTSNELQTFGHSGTTSYTNTLSNGGGSFTLQSSGIVTISNSSGTVTIGATEVDGSVTNELQTIANTSDATSHTVTLSNSGGSIQMVEGSGITLTTTGTSGAGILTIASTAGSTDLTFSGASSPVTLNSSTGTDVTLTAGGINSFSATSGNITITATEVDGSVTNEAWTIDGDDADTEVISNQTVKFQGAGITTTDYNPATDVLLITSTEVDGSTSNELQTFGHSGTTSYTNTLSNGGGSFTLQSSGIVTISNSSGTVTIGATEVDGSVTNELQTIANTSDATSHTVTLSNSGGSVQLVEGSNITLTTTGTSGAGIVTIASTGGGSTDLTFSGTSSPVTLNSSTGTDVTLTAGGINTMSASSGNITITATEVDGSVTNELQTIANTSDATSHTVTLSNSGGSVQLVEGSNITLTTTGTSGAGIVTIAATSATNFASVRGYVEGQTGTTIDLDANDGKTKDVDGTNLAFDVPSNVDNFKIYKNGIELTRTGTGTTRDYSVDAGTNIVTFTTALVSTDRVIVQYQTGSAVDLFTSGELTGNGTSASPIKLAQQSATSGQVLEWNGSAWAPAADAGSPSVITPSQITSDQDNYSPTSWSTATVVRLSSDAFRAITSFSAGSPGEEKTLVNVGSFPIYLPGEHPDGTAANRISTPYDYFIFPQKAAKILYDNTLSRWIVSTEKETYRKGLTYSFSAGSTTAGDWGQITLTTSGTSAAAGTATATSALPGALTFATGTTTTGMGCVSFSKTVATPFYFSGAHLVTEGTVSLPALSDGTNTYTAAIQITNSPTSTSISPNNTVGIRYTHGTNSGKWQGYSRDNAGAETTADLGVTVATNTPYNLRIEVDKQNTEVRFYINGIMAGRAAANMPTAGVCGSREVIVKSAGTTASTLNCHSMYAESIY